MFDNNIFNYTRARFQRFCRLAADSVTSRASGAAWEMIAAC